MIHIFRLLVPAVALAALGMLESPVAVAQGSSDQTAPQKVPEASQDQKPGQTLSGQLKQSDGVIHPHPSADTEAVRPTPPTGPNSTPVIPPPGSPGGDQTVRPK